MERTKEASKNKRATTTMPTPDELKTREVGFQQNPRKQAIVKETYQRYVQMRDARNRRFRYFNNRTLIEIIDDATKRFGLFQRPRSSAEDWQTTYVGPETRNKTIAILARLASQRMKRSYYGVTENNKWKARICRAFDEWAALKNNDDVQFFFKMLSAITKGTVIGYETYAAPLTKYWDITDFDPLTNEMKMEEKSRRDWNDVIGEIVPLEEFYPGDVRKLHINGPNSMLDCGRERFLSYAEFQKSWRKYPDAQYVRPAGEMRELPFFKDLIPGECGDDQVWVFEYYKKPGHTPDAMNFISNGLLLTQENSGLPFNHKLRDRGLPFWEGGFEPYAEDFFYRMPLPIKLKGDQDGNDSVMRMSIDLLHLFLNRPIITNDPEDIEEKTFGPGVVYKVTDPQTGYKEMNISGPGNEAMSYMNLFLSKINSSSVDNVTQGQSSGSQGVTATATDAAVQGALELMSLFNTFMEWAVTEEGYLRISNQCQFYPMAIGKEEDGEPKMREMRVDNIPRIIAGTNGSVCLYFVPTKADLPGGAPKLDPQQRARLAETYGDDFDEIVVKIDPSNPELEHVYFTAKFMRDFAAGVKAIPQSSVKMSDNYQRAHEKEFQQWAMAYFGDMVDRQKMFREFAETYDKDPDELILEQAKGPAGAQPQQPGVDPELAALGIGLDQPGQTTTPGGNAPGGAGTSAVLGNQRAGQVGKPPTPPTTDTLRSKLSGY